MCVQYCPHRGSLGGSCDSFARLARGLYLFGLDNILSSSKDSRLQCPCCRRYISLERHSNLLNRGLIAAAPRCNTLVLTILRLVVACVLGSVILLQPVHQSLFQPNIRESPSDKL